MATFFHYELFFTLITVFSVLIISDQSFKEYYCYGLAAKPNSNLDTLGKLQKQYVYKVLVCNFLLIWNWWLNMKCDESESTEICWICSSLSFCSEIYSMFWNASWFYCHQLWYIPVLSFLVQLVFCGINLCIAFHWHTIKSHETPELTTIQLYCVLDNQICLKFAFSIFLCLFS